MMQVGLPASAVDLEGLACDPVAHRLYGVGEDSSIWAYDVQAGSWSVVGDSALTWDNAGLAWDPTPGLLYATSADLGDFRCAGDPGSAAASLVGAIGAGYPFGGALTFAPTWRGTLDTPVFIDGVESLDTGKWTDGYEP